MNSNRSSTANFLTYKSSVNTSVPNSYVKTTSTQNYGFQPLVAQQVSSMQSCSIKKS